MSITNLSSVNSVQKTSLITENLTKVKGKRLFSERNSNSQEQQNVTETFKRIKKSSLESVNNLEVNPIDFTATPLLSTPKCSTVVSTIVSTDYSFPTSSYSFPKRKGPPPAPRKKSTQSTQTDFQVLRSKILSNSFCINNQPVSLQFLGKGSFMDAYTLEASAPVVSSTPNDKVVLKTYNSERSSSNPAKLSKFLKSSIANYKQAQNLNLPVATIYNIKTALEDKFFLQEKIPHPANVTNASHISQLRQFLLASLKNQVCFDLLPQNLRVTEESALTLIDFVEDKSDGIMVFINHAVKLWATEMKEVLSANITQVAKFLSDLTQDFDQYGYDLNYNQQILDNLFFEIRSVV